MINLAAIKYNEQQLVPAIIQDQHTNTVLMMAYMNREALEKTLASGFTWFFSRSRNRLWHKGETSGHVQKVQEVYYDCDADTLLIKVEQTGAACHEGTFSCFSRRLDGGGAVAERLVDPAAVYGGSAATVIQDLYGVITDRQRNPKEGSYTNYLFCQGSGQDSEKSW